MLHRLHRDGLSEKARYKGFAGFKVSRLLFETLKRCNFETSALLADAELADHGLIALGIVFLEVVEQASSLADQHEKSAARAVVFFVRLEVLRQLPDALAQQGDLNFRTARVAGMRRVPVNEVFLLLSG